MPPSPEAATLADGWKDRLVPLTNANTRGVTGWCLSPIDLLLSKLAAGRAKAFRFIRAVLHHRLFGELRGLLTNRFKAASFTCSSTAIAYADCGKRESTPFPAKERCPTLQASSSCVGYPMYPPFPAIQPLGGTT